MKRSARQQAWQWGRWAEGVAVGWLRLKGYRILQRRWIFRGGEIDIIAYDGQTLVLVEVKYRRQNQEAALWAVDAGKMQRLYRGADLFQQQYRQFRGSMIRFDLLILSAWRWPLHLRNVWHKMDSC